MKLRSLNARALASLLAALVAWPAASAWAAYTYNTGTPAPGDGLVGLDSSAFGGADAFNADLRTAPGAKVGVILLHGRGESYIDGHAILPLRLDLSAIGYDTLSIDTPLPKVDGSYPAPLSPAAYANFQYDINSGPNYVVPETFARVRAAESALQAQGATSVVLVGFSLGSRLGAAFMSSAANNGVLPVLGYVGIGMGSDAIAAPLDSPTSMLGVKSPVLDLYSSADNPDVLAGAVARQANYSSVSYTSFQQNMAPTYTVPGDGHQWVGFEPQLIMLTENWLAAQAPVPEPPALCAMLAGIAGLAWRYRSLKTGRAHTDHASG